MAHWPPAIPATTIATLPLPGLTAYQAVQALRLKPGETLLINGPLGAVGSIVTQLAARAEIRIAGVVRHEEQAAAARLGVSIFIERGSDITKASRLANLSIDAALDVVGGEVAAQTLSAVRNNGRYVTLIPHIGLGLPTPQRGIIQQNVLIVPDAAQLEKLAKLVKTGAIVLPEPTVLPLYNIQKAYELMAGKQSHKKIVITM